LPAGMSTVAGHMRLRLVTPRENRLFARFRV
jgi:hypothetical protein